jgi:hypothetical protein
VKGPEFKPQDHQKKKKNVLNGVLKFAPFPEEFYRHLFFYVYDNNFREI